MTKVFSVVVKKSCILRDSEKERKGAKGMKRLEEDGKLNYEPKNYFQWLMTEKY